ncbi:hypothetical protein PAF15_05950 [Weissella koreensis]|uniref:hypothetical protein n=1 Tax=Weissella koreensis TaxID=165096 RepID=UPI0002175A7A|nr:hypothetical protein [Weissella koreensis]AEJ24161.1 hypothetical protein WKK_06455 [Weissella koreensis KACC 15510]MCZ9311484.1 hypothetical protein [Weissella koreensis]
MKKKRWWLIGIAAIILLLIIGIAIAKFTHKNNDSQNQGQIKTSQKINEDSIKPLQDGAKHKTNKRTYEVSKNDSNSDQYVASGNLTKPGQYSISPAGNRSELQQINANPDQQLMDSEVSYTLNKIKVQLNQPKTDEALQMARMALNDRSIDGDYQTLILNYSITNKTNRIIQTDGVKEVELSSNDVVTVQSGLDNDAKLSQKMIQPGETVETFATILVGKDGQEKQILNRATIAFAPVLDQNQNVITSDSQKMTAKF